jgi:hypothetical protein
MLVPVIPSAAVAYSVIVSIGVCLLFLCGVAAGGGMPMMRLIVRPIGLVLMSMPVIPRAFVTNAIIIFVSVIALSAGSEGENKDKRGKNKYQFFHFAASF